MYAHMYPAWKVTLPMAITQLGPCLDQGWSPSPKWWSRGLGRLLEQLEQLELTWGTSWSMLEMLPQKNSDPKRSAGSLQFLWITHRFFLRRKTHLPVQSEWRAVGSVSGPIPYSRDRRDSIQPKLGMNWTLAGSLMNPPYVCMYIWYMIYVYIMSTPDSGSI